ncbi:A47L-like protein [Penguinpox virus]|uniref:A47L-like protein n=1 Tax=Penguinpox virus TaxID=648998 RepID=A0A068EHW8_9POXV|nr:A47L-like protein [Penguinpox virus]AID46958.1 A47L-like protein [Penguinpox virus]
MGNNNTRGSKKNRLSMISSKKRITSFIRKHHNYLMKVFDYLSDDGKVVMIDCMGHWLYNKWDYEPNMFLKCISERSDIEAIYRELAKKTLEDAKNYHDIFSRSVPNNLGISNKLRTVMDNNDILIKKYNSTNYYMKKEIIDSKVNEFQTKRTYEPYLFLQTLERQLRGSNDYFYNDILQAITL